MDITYKKIYSIQYSLLSPDTIRKMSAARVIVPELYDEEGYPVRGGLMDTRMGVIDPGLVCSTCGKPAGKCPGHFGHLELARPVIHIEFVQIIGDILNSVCHQCGRVRLTEEEKKFAMEKIAKYKSEHKISRLSKFIKKFVINRSSKRRKCPYCGYENPEIEFRKPYYFYVKLNNEGSERRLYPTEIRSILEKIPNDDLQLFGLDPYNSRPEWMILTVLPIPPVTVRPSIILESGERAEDDLTHKLVDIVRANQRLKEAITTGAPQVVIDQLWDLLQYHISTYFNNTLSSLPRAKHRSGKAIKSLVERIMGKYGRIRYNLLGKRANYTARAVISPDPYIKPNEVGVPIYVAMILTVPEKVNKYNIEKLKKFVLNGPNKYPGANYVIPPDGKRRIITEENKEQLASMLEPGWIVERHLIDGDIVLFNRQPSLHRMSMMGHIVKVLPGNTFRINPLVCLPYNADFDGDEMNLHVPQTEEARAEAKLLAGLENHIITPRYGKFIVGGKQDVITGLYLLTKDGTKLSFGEAAQLLYQSGATKQDLEKLSRLIENAKKEGRDYLTGKEVFSAILPDNFDLILPDIKIENGIIKEGVLKSSLIKEENGLLFLYLIYEGFDRRFVLEILHKAGLLGINYQYMHGITMGIGDLDISKEAEKQIKEILNDAIKKADELYKNYKEGNLKRLPGRTLKDVYEIYARQIASDALSNIQSLIRKSMSPESNAYLMAETKARGSWDDITRMVASLGFQEFRGRFIDFGYEGRNLTIFEKGNEHPLYKGWVISSYREGLKPWEMFFHALPGRDALMDTTVRTQNSGYLYRRMAHALYELFVYSDLTVRDSYNRVIEYMYGEDGIAVNKSVSGKLDLEMIAIEMLSKGKEEAKEEKKEEVKDKKAKSKSSKKK